MVQALLIGVSYAKTRYELAGCIPDIEYLKAYLVSRNITSISVLRDDYGKPSDKHYPSRKNVLYEMAKLLRGGEDCYIHFSGHGFAVDGGSLTTAGYRVSEEADACLLVRPQLTPTIKDIGVTNTVCNDSIIQLFSLLSPDKRLLITVDACCAGSMFDLPCNIQMTQGSPSNKAHYNMRVNSKVHATHPNVALFTAVRTHKYSWDVTVGGKTYGIFTKTFVDILESSAKNGKPNLSWLDILYILDRNLRHRKDPQDPQLSVSSKEILSQTVFI